MKTASSFHWLVLCTAVTLCVPIAGKPTDAQETRAASEKVSEQDIQQSLKKIPYKTVGDKQLHLHVFYPEGHQKTDRRPAIVFFFGGGWVGGSPSQFYKQAWYLSQRGMVAACAEYRVRSRDNTTPVECVQDGKSAMRYVRQNAEAMGVDPEKIVAAGGSAGGHVAAATATVTKFNESSDDQNVSAVPCALVLFNPVLDNGPDGWGHERVKAYWQDISPMHNIKKPATPSLFLLGDQDKLIPVEVGKRYQKRVQENEGRCELKITQNAGHGYFNRGPAFIDTLQATDDFLVSLGLLKGASSVKAKLGHLAGPKEKKKKKRNQQGESSGQPKSDKKGAIK